MSKFHSKYKYYGRLSFALTKVEKATITHVLHSRQTISFNRLFDRNMQQKIMFKLITKIRPFFLTHSMNWIWIGKLFTFNGNVESLNDIFTFLSRHVYPARYLQVTAVNLRFGLRFLISIECEVISSHCTTLTYQQPFSPSPASLLALPMR